MHHIPSPLHLHLHLRHDIQRQRPQSAQPRHEPPRVIQIHKATTDNNNRNAISTTQPTVLPATMARAAVLPKSPAKRGSRTVPRAAMKTTAASAARAKASADVRKKTTAKAAPANYDSDDTDDELDVLTKQPEKPRVRAKPAAHTATKATSSSTGRGRKVAPVEETQAGTEDEPTAKTEPKKRVGRPKKTPAAAGATTTTAPKARGRPKGSTNKTTQTTTTSTTRRKNTRTVPEPEPSSDTSDPKRIVIATNSTTMRSNILRGPAKKKTVTFRDVMESGSEEDDELAVTAPTTKKAATQTTGKAGLGGTPVRKGATRGRKPAKTDVAQPLSPKKAKQMAKTLSAYASSDGEDDELAATKDDSPVRLVVHSPVKDAAENPSLASPVRKINFTPKKASNMVDENGEPKASTPKHGSTGLGSPVRKINFTPKRSQNTHGDDHLALPPGKNIDFTESMFMSSPARRPELSPFKFSHADTPNARFTQSISAPNFTPAQASPLKMSPRKGQLGASFLQSPAKNSTSTAAFPARTSLFLSPAKKGASPFKSSLFAPKSSVTEQAPQEEQISTTPTSLPKQSPIAPRSAESQRDRDIDMVEEVARDIFGIELQSYRPMSESPLLKESFNVEFDPEMEVEETDDANPEPVEMDDATQHCEAEPVLRGDLTSAPGIEIIEVGDATEDSATENVSTQNPLDTDVDDKLEALQKEIQNEPEDFGTICFNTMESLQAPFEAFEQPAVVEDELNLEDSASIQDDASEVDEQHEDILPFSVAEDADEDFAAPVLQPLTPQEAQNPNQEDLGMLHSERSLNFDTLERIQASIESDSDQETDYDNEIEDAVHSVQQSDEDYESEEMENDEPIVMPAEATLEIMFNAGLPDQWDGSEQRTHPFERMPSIPPTSSYPPPANHATPFSVQDSAMSQGKLYDINLEPRMDDVEESLLETTQTEMPTPRAPTAADTPSIAARRKSNFNVNQGFTPLAQQFGHWETNTPSQDRPGRPRRRGVFSLVGPLEKTTEPSTPEAGDVSYPDLSRTPLANTPYLFAELPLQERTDDGSMSPVSVATEKSPAATEYSEIMDSPSRSEIFEDRDHTVLEQEHEKIRARQVSSTPEPVELQEQGMRSDEEKENSETTIIPATPIRAIPEQRTVHTISKVPLKGEGEMSPLKIPRKRGHSLSGASPTRSSTRIRKPAFKPFVDSAPTLSPTRKSPRVDRSPSPKRRCSAPRRSMEAPESHSVVRSPSKSPRKSKPTSQALQGAVVHVDVHTTEGEDASGIFVELLQQMGARCVMSWSWNGRSSLSPVDGADPKDARVGITHVVYKDGGLRTLEKVKQASGLVKCVGVGWVLEEKTNGSTKPPYSVDSSIVPRGGAKRPSGRRCGADRGAIDGFRKITPPSPQKDVPSTPTQQSSSDQYNFPQTPGYNFANLDAIGMSPATPYFLSNRNQLVQQSCPPKQTNKGLFPVSVPSFSLEQESEEDARQQQRARMEAARRKSTFYRPAIGSPLKR
ncbi:hypothetical protein N7481_007676 [Penicillium waksmanii]|uniref:uncharacterized protein n=1 Tax=Penicillium waksmanii TaxID=69791 RepID=UPI002547D1C1|nr:uncharacterized protein N7481_007676 [Penicillium waksmanii]KAJ5980378.1 hypothetical protein N7481_007676 [Penicillium waksmanii]